jgi:hypothetical protein
MELPALEIGGRDVSFGVIWVHFQSGDTPDARDFTLTVPSPHVREIFDPHGNCPPSVSLDAYLMELISEFGTFVVDGYVQSIRQLLNLEVTGYAWVIATVDDVKDTGTALVLRGRVVPFVPNAPKFRNLR